MSRQGQGARSCFVVYHQSNGQAGARERESRQEAWQKRVEAQAALCCLSDGEGGGPMRGVAAPFGKPWKARVLRRKLRAVRFESECLGGREGARGGEWKQAGRQGVAGARGSGSWRSAFGRDEASRFCGGAGLDEFKQLLVNQASIIPQPAAAATARARRRLGQLPRRRSGAAAGAPSWSRRSSWGELAPAQRRCGGRRACHSGRSPWSLGACGWCR